MTEKEVLDSAIACRRFDTAVSQEMLEAQKRFGSFHSLHEAKAVLDEEVWEFTQHVYTKETLRDRPSIFAELVQIGAIVRRIAYDLLGEPVLPHEAMNGSGYERKG